MQEVTVKGRLAQEKEVLESITKMLRAQLAVQSAFSSSESEESSSPPGPNPTKSEDDPTSGQQGEKQWQGERKHLLCKAYICWQCTFCIYMAVWNLQFVKIIVCGNTNLLQTRSILFSSFSTLAKAELWWSWSAMFGSAFKHSQIRSRRKSRTIWQ